MNKRDLIKAIAKTGVPYRTAQGVVDTLLEEIRGCVSSGEDVVLNGFGTFTSKRWNGRRVTKMHTSEMVKVKSRRTPVFIPSKKFKNQINTLGTGTTA